MFISLDRWRKDSDSRIGMMGMGRIICGGKEETMLDEVMK